VLCPEGSGCGAFRQHHAGNIDGEDEHIFANQFVK
jgi:hypothetical protein